MPAASWPTRTSRPSPNPSASPPGRSRRLRPCNPPCARRWPAGPRRWSRWSATSPRTTCRSSCSHRNES